MLLWRASLVVYRKYYTEFATVAYIKNYFNISGKSSPDNNRVLVIIFKKINFLGWECSMRIYEYISALKFRYIKFT